MQPMLDPITILTPRHTIWDGGIIPIFLGVNLDLSSQDNSFYIIMLLKIINPISIKINLIFSRLTNTISSLLTNISNKIIQIGK